MSRGVTRRDPSTVLKIGARYYVWYTRRKTAAKRRQAPPGEQTWQRPAFDRDLAEIWYATSTDGFHWEEQGVAARRGPRDAHDGRSIFTPDILYAQGEDGPLQQSYLLRFECNLRRGKDRQDFYRSWNYRFPAAAYLSTDFRLTAEQRAAARELMREIDVETTAPD